MKYLVEIKGDKPFDKCFVDIDVFDNPPICITKIEPINEEELDRIADELNPNNPHGDTYEMGQYFGFQDGFIAGYHKAKEEI